MLLCAQTAQVFVQARKATDSIAVMLELLRLLLVADVRLHYKHNVMCKCAQACYSSLNKSVAATSTECHSA